MCLSEETLKAGGPFYLVYMPGEVKNVKPVVDSLILEKNNYCVSPNLGCLEVVTSDMETAYFADRSILVDNYCSLWLELYAKSFVILSRPNISTNRNFFEKSVTLQIIPMDPLYHMQITAWYLQH